MSATLTAREIHAHARLNEAIAEVIAAEAEKDGRDPGILVAHVLVVGEVKWDHEAAINIVVKNGDLPFWEAAGLLERGLRYLSAE